MPFPTVNKRKRLTKKYFDTGEIEVTYLPKIEKEDGTDQETLGYAITN